MSKQDIETSLDESPSKRIKLETPRNDEKENICLRKFKKIPIFIVEYHNDVLEFIYRCFGSRHLPLYNNTIIHFDSHPDMVISNDIEPELIYDKNKLLENLSIENWIMPTCYGEHLKKIVWIKNSWCQQIHCGEFKFNIGDYDNELYVDLKIPYFISEGNYCSNDKLNNKKEIHLKVIEIDNERNNNNKIEEDKILKEESDNKGGNFSNINEFITDNNLILDIDLDYFSTANPFLNIYEKIDCYKRITEIFDYKINENNFEIDYEKRKFQLKNLKEIFQYLDYHRDINENVEILIENDIIIIEKILELIKLIKENYNDNEIDWILIYNAGCTSDNNGLPHFISPDETLNIYFDSFKNFLKNLKYEPIAITISRSTEDGYCPSNKVDFIQQNVINILQSIYRDKLNSNPILWYEETNWDITKL
ncbi:UPF0489 protein C5orf22 homolog [Condylostylus longicornis]|uniref:UPF0489 protein C5orf22 homolog n=1 Tax=Condylostylus longicornis TaxID=2530218 RepID=UPI00244DC6FD|nr:UPF0489 protein C5orf22 homolog [Condylostylus longicornis]